MSLPLEDLGLIKRLKYAYCRCIDTANFTELKDLMTEDSSVRYVGGSYVFEAQGRDTIIEALANAFHSEAIRSEEHTSELQSLMRISYAVFCLKKKTTRIITIWMLL